VLSCPLLLRSFNFGLTLCILVVCSQRIFEFISFISLLESNTNEGVGVWSTGVHYAHDEISRRIQHSVYRSSSVCWWYHKRKYD
jgi:hypothetical protein